MHNPANTRYMQIAEELRQSDQRNHEFWKALKHFFGQTDFDPLAKSPTTILNIACGDCEESRIITSFFSTGIYGYPSDLAILIGIDFDEVKIQRAKNLVKIPAVSDPSDHFVIMPNCTFIHGDATKLNEYPEIPKQADLILIRHQFIANDLKTNENTWYKIFAEAIRHLDKDGIMMVTSFKQAENQVLMHILANLDCEVLINEQNPYCIPYGEKYPEVAYDKFVTLIRRA